MNDMFSFWLALMAVEGASVMLLGIIVFVALAFIAGRRT